MKIGTCRRAVEKNREKLENEKKPLGFGTTEGLRAFQSVKKAFGAFASNKMHAASPAAAFSVRFVFLWDFARVAGKIPKKKGNRAGSPLA